MLWAVRSCLLSLGVFYVFSPKLLFYTLRSSVLLGIAKRCCLSPPLVKPRRSATAGNIAELSNGSSAVSLTASLGSIPGSAIIIITLQDFYKTDFSKKVLTFVG